MAKMNNWKEQLIAEECNQDSLEKIRDTLTGAILPMAAVMETPPTTLQLTLLRDELMDLVYRLEDMLYTEALNGD